MQRSREKKSDKPHKRINSFSARTQSAWLNVRWRELICNLRAMGKQ